MTFFIGFLAGFALCAIIASIGVLVAGVVIAGRDDHDL